MNYKKGDLVLVQVSYDTRLRKEYAVVQSQYINAVRVFMTETGKSKVYHQRFLTPVITEEL